MKTLQTTLFAVMTFISFGTTAQIDETQILQESKEAFTFNKAQVMLLGTWHMGTTTDAHKSSYNASEPRRQEEIAELAKQLATFKPTKILVEISPEEQAELDAVYAAYKNNPSKPLSYYGEVGLLAFQIARLSGATLHATDHEMGYDYPSIGKLAQETQNAHYNGYYAKVGPFMQKVDALENKATTKQLYRFTNTQNYLDFLFNVNADLLIHVNTKDNFEGANVAADYYTRNLRIYANFNRLDITPNDRVLVLYGASHVAFFHDFMKRSHLYEVVDVQEYLKD
jgi:hypothetical protein